jgi:hypothetical protein
MCRRGKRATAVLATMLLSCATGPELRDPRVRIAATRLAALPAQGQIFVVGSRGRKISDAALSGAVLGNVNDSISYLLHQHGARSFGSAATARLDRFSEFFHWSWGAMNEIMAERLGNEPAIHRSVAEWRFRHDITSWRPVLDADFVLVSFILYAAPGGGLHGPGVDLERSMTADSLSLTGAGSRAIACVVALDSGQIVWCNFIPNNSVTMQERPAAQSAVDVLLGDMLKLGDGAR